MKNAFRGFAATQANEKWEKMISRTTALYQRADEIRSPFARDATRILHSNAYRRLKHKTQVFFNIDNDHVCTRMEHVAHVESVSGTIAAYLGLNGELTSAIAMGHDLGHAPFGHEGERVISELTEKYLGEKFWHERNGLRFVDKIELLCDNYNVYRNLDLTYAVRDGIISHCGEADVNGLRPRGEALDLLCDYNKPNEYAPYTWEGCVVKISDKIAYVGRDIEDAVSLGFIEGEQLDILRDMARANDERALNTTVIMHNLIQDICAESSPERGIALSGKFYAQLNEIKKFNYKYIYKNPRLEPFRKYCRLILSELFDFFAAAYDGAETFLRLENSSCPSVARPFAGYLARYCCEETVPAALSSDFCGANEKIYGALASDKVYFRAITDYLSGMTDRYAVKAFEGLINY